MKFSDLTAAALATTTGLGGATAGLACCVLPLMLASIGLGAGGLAALVPFHTPLTAIALLAVAAGWLLYLRRRRACATGSDCTPPSGLTFGLLITASMLVAVSTAWPFIEAPLMEALGG